MLVRNTGNVIVPNAIGWIRNTPNAHFLTLETTQPTSKKEPIPLVTKHDDPKKHLSTTMKGLGVTYPLKMASRGGIMGNPIMLIMLGWAQKKTKNLNKFSSLQNKVCYGSIPFHDTRPHDTLCAHASNRWYNSQCVETNEMLSFSFLLHSFPSQHITSHNLMHFGTKLGSNLPLRIVHKSDQIW